MWLALVCAFILYKLLRLFFGDDDVLDVETSDFNALFAVAARLLSSFYSPFLVPSPSPGFCSSFRNDYDCIH